MGASGSTLLFVYGTLKRGCSNHPFLRGQAFVGEARTVPGFRLYNLGEYPGMVADETDRHGIEGEVWSVDAAGLADVDHLEGIDQGLYRREAIRLISPFANDAVETYIYALSVEGRPEVGSRWTE